MGRSQPPLPGGAEPRAAVTMRTAPGTSPAQASRAARAIAEIDGPRRCRIRSGDDGMVVHDGEPGVRHRMAGHPRHGFAERRAGGLAIALAEVTRALRVPGVRGGLAGIEVSARFERQLAIERRHGFVRGAARQAQQPFQPVQRHHRERRGLGAIRRPPPPARCPPRVRPGPARRAPRTRWPPANAPPAGAGTRPAPAARSAAGFRPSCPAPAAPDAASCPVPASPPARARPGHRPACRSAPARSRASPTPRPGPGSRRQACCACDGGQPQGVGVRRRVGAGGLELHHAGVGHADVVRRLTRVLLEQSLERGAGRADADRIGATPGRRGLRSSARCGASSSSRSGSPSGLWTRGDGRDELIPVPRHGLDVAVPIVGVEPPAQLTDQLSRGCCPPRQCRPTRRGSGRLSRARRLARRTSRWRTSY